jgi:RNA polymerase sigma factor (sigma-70 family)
MKQQFIDAYDRMTPERWEYVVQNRKLIPYLAKKWRVDYGIVLDGFVLAASKFDLGRGTFSGYACYIARLKVTEDFQRRKTNPNTILRYLRGKDKFTQKGYEDAELISKAVDSLEPDLREIVRMKFWQGLTQKEIAKKLFISEYTMTRVMARIYGELYDAYSIYR